MATGRSAVAPAIAASARWVNWERLGMPVRVSWRARKALVRDWRRSRRVTEAETASRQNHTSSRPPRMARASAR